MKQPKEGSHFGPFVAEIVTVRGSHVKLSVPAWDTERMITVRGKHLRRALGRILLPGQYIFVDAVLAASSAKGTALKNFRKLPLLIDANPHLLRDFEV